MFAVTCCGITLYIKWGAPGEAATPYIPTTYVNFLNFLNLHLVFFGIYVRTIFVGYLITHTRKGIQNVFND